MKRLKKFARSMAELMIAVAVIGVIIALIVGLNNTKGTNYSTATAKKNQFENTIGELQKAMLSDPTMTAHKACDAAALRDYYIDNLTGASAVDYQMDGQNVAALRIPGYGILVILPNADVGYCEKEWHADDLNPSNPPVALVAVSEGGDPSDVPIKVRDGNGDGYGDFGGIDNNAKSGHGAVGATNKDEAAPFNMFRNFRSANNDDIASAFAFSQNMAAVVPLDNTVGSTRLGSTPCVGSNCPDSTPTYTCTTTYITHYAHENFELVEIGVNINDDGVGELVGKEESQHSYQVCHPDSVFNANNLLYSQYFKLENDEAEQTCRYNNVGPYSFIPTGSDSWTFCPGNGFLTEADAKLYSQLDCKNHPEVTGCANIKIVDSGQVNQTCFKGVTGFNACQCPDKRGYWLGAIHFPRKSARDTIGKPLYNYDANNVDLGRCVASCSAVDPRLTFDSGKNCVCNTALGLADTPDWKTGKCVCANSNEVFNEQQKKCVPIPTCDESKGQVPDGQGGCAQCDLSSMQVINHECHCKGSLNLRDAATASYGATSCACYEGFSKVSGSSYPTACECNTNTVKNHEVVNNPSASASVYTDSDKICQCKSKNDLKSVLFDKKARYDSSKNVCYVACDTNQYPANEYTECKSCDTTDSKIVPHSADAAEPYTCDCDEDKEYVTDGNSCMPCKSSEGFMIVGNHCHCDSVKNLKDKTVTQYGNATECEPYKGYTPDCNGSCSGGEKVVKASCDTDNKNKIVEEINTTTTKTKINDKFDDDDRFCRCPVFGEEAYDTLIAVLAGTKYHYSNDNDKNNLVELTCTAPCPDNVTSSDGVSCPEAVCPTEGTSEYTNFINNLEADEIFVNDYTNGCKASCDATAHRVPNAQQRGDNSPKTICVCDEDEGYVESNGQCVKCDSGDNDGFVIIDHTCHCDSSKNLKDVKGALDNDGNATKCEPYLGYTGTPDSNNTGSYIKAECKKENNNKVEESKNTTAAAINAKFDDDDKICRCVTSAELDNNDTFKSYLTTNKKVYLNTGTDTAGVCSIACPSNQTSYDGKTCHCDMDKNLRDASTTSIYLHSTIKDSGFAQDKCLPYDGFTGNPDPNKEGSSTSASCVITNGNKIEKTLKSGADAHASYTNGDDKVCRCVTSADGTAYNTFKSYLKQDNVNARYVDDGTNIEGTCSVPCPVNQKVSNDVLECHCDTGLIDVGYTAEKKQADSCRCHEGFTPSVDEATGVLTCLCDFPRKAVGDECKCLSETEIHDAIEKMDANNPNKSYMNGYTYNSDSPECRNSCPDNSASQFEEGEYRCINCPSDSIYIYNKTDLDNVRSNLDKNYCLMKDINVGPISPIGNTGTPFTGGFYGNQHVLSNITITPNGNGEALFGMSSGNIQDLGINNITVAGSSNEPVAAVAAFNAGTIYRVYVKNDEGSTNAITPAANASGIGCLAGLQTEGTIRESYCSGVNIDASAEGVNNAGALVGWQYEGATLQDCYVSDSTLKIGDNTDHFGGIVGNQSGIIKYVYSTCLLNSSTGVLSSDTIGGISGSISGASADTIKSYWLSDAGYVNSGDINTAVGDYGGVLLEDSTAARNMIHLVESNPLHPNMTECLSNDDGSEKDGSCTTVSTYNETGNEYWSWIPDDGVWCFSCSPERLPVLSHVPNKDIQCASGTCSCMNLDDECSYCEKQYPEKSACKDGDNKIGLWSREECKCNACPSNRPDYEDQKCVCKNAEKLCYTGDKEGYIDKNTCKCTACPDNKPNYDEDKKECVCENVGAKCTTTDNKEGYIAENTCACTACPDETPIYDPQEHKCVCKVGDKLVGQACEVGGVADKGRVVSDAVNHTCKCEPCPGIQTYDEDYEGCYCPEEDTLIESGKIDMSINKGQYFNANAADGACISQCKPANVAGKYSIYVNGRCFCPNGDAGIAAFGYDTAENCGCPEGTSRTKVASLYSDSTGSDSLLSDGFVCACSAEEANKTGSCTGSACHDLSSGGTASTGEWIAVMVNGVCSWMYDPLVVDYDKDSEIESKVGCGVDLTGKGGVKLCATGGDKMLAIKRINSSREIDRTMIFGTDTVDPFNNAKPIHSINGFEALNEIAMSAMAYADDHNIDVQVFGIEGYNDLRAIKYLLNQIGWDIGFISDDNITTLEPLGHVIAISKQYQEKADTGAQMEQKQVGTYMDTAKQLFKAADVWVRTTFKNLFNK